MNCGKFLRAAVVAAMAVPALLLADAVVTFNEVNYNPAGTQDGEWIELHNQMAVDIDLSGWSLANAIDYTFASGTIIPAGGYCVIAKTPATASLAGVSGVLGPFTGNLSNGGETIDLLSRSGRLMDRLAYGDSDEWPVAADGVGATLAKRLAGTDSASAGSWTASAAPGGTPAAANFPLAGVPLRHVFAGADSIWRFNDSNTAPAAAWTSVGFDDASWATGQAMFGTSSAAPVLTVTANLVERYRAGAITGVANGASFSQWSDAATADGAAQNAVAGGNPTYRTNVTPTLQPVVRFDGSDEYRTALAPGITPTSGFAYFIVCKANSVPLSGSITGGDGAYIFDRNITTNDTPLASLKVVNNRYGFQKRDDAGGGLGGPLSTSPVSTTRFQIVALRRNPSAARFEIWVDGVMESVVADDGHNLTPQPVVIGCHGTGVSQGLNLGFDGDIAELLVYRNALTDDDFRAVGAYLEASHGLDTAFPNTTVRTLLAPAATTSYFRKTFSFTGDPARTALRLDHTVADGAVFYLNGQELARTNLAAGTVTHATAALANIAQPLASGFQALPAGILVAGTNVLAVSLHKAAADPGAFFAASLEATEAPPDPAQQQGFALHEIAGSSDAGFFIELRNGGTTPLSTAGYSLAIAGGASFALPASSVGGGGLVSFSQAELGYLPVAGDKIVLHAPDATIADARVVATTAAGRSDSYPGQWLSPAVATPGGANQFALTSDIVINEICYKAPDLEEVAATPALPSPQQWIELYNRGAATVDLAGWKFATEPSYVFPAGTTLAPGACLVVARDPGLVPAAAGATLLGPWTGKLSGKGQRIRLLDAAGNPADEVSYVDGGRWPATPDGGGSTLELRDAHADNSLPETWAASDESARRTWQTITYQGVAAASAVGPDNQWREFIFGLLDAGEVLLDDITVTENPGSGAVSLISGGNFESGSGGWRFLGNHSDAQIITDPTNPANHVLRLRATGATEHMHNHVETTLANSLSVVNGRTYQISLRARWLSGANRLNTRLYFNRLAHTSLLTRTGTLGTPGRVNSTALPNVGPGFSAFSHSPAVPEPGEAVTVTARAADPDGLGALTLFYSPAGGAWVSVPMTAAAGDAATFSAAIPGYPAAAVLRFYVAASDAAASAATAYFPAQGPGSHALYQVNDGLAATNGLHNIRIVMDPVDKALLYRTNNLMSNDRIGCTVIYRESEIYYNAGVRLKSSQRGRPEAPRVGFNLLFNDDQLFRGVHNTIAIDRSEGGATGAQEILYDHMMYASGGIPAEFNDLVKVIAPDPANTSSAILQMARFGPLYLDSQFDNGADGTVYEYELIYYPTTVDATGYKLPQPDDVVRVGITSLGADKENYRWNYLTKNSEDKDDYSRVIAMAGQFDKTGAAFDATVNEVLDVDQWLRALAYSCACGAGDSFFDNAHHNGQFYARPADGRVLYFPHDLDIIYNATLPIFLSNELQELTVDVARKRAYLGHLHDICTTVFNSSYMSAWTSHYGGLLPNENFAGHLSYITTRSNFILASINAQIAPVNFAITTNGGANFATNDTPVALAGQGWVNVRDIRLAGATTPLDVTWTSANTWQTVVPVGTGANQLTLQAIDFSGLVVGTASITITNTGSIQLPDAGNLVVSGIYYNPLLADDLSEYIELRNISATATIDLSGLTFTQGIGFSFPNGSRLLPGARVVVVKNLAAFESEFGPGHPVAGVYTGSLDNAGELITLCRADNTLVRSFIYDDAAPWPTTADTAGYSLVLVDASSNPDPSDPASWRASDVPGGEAGGFDLLNGVAALTWDANGATAPNPNGGTGTWDAGATANWWDGVSANMVWPAPGATDNDAVFANTAGTVTLAAGGVTANDLTFTTTGYLIQSNTLTLNGTTPTLTTAPGVSATISSIVAGSAGLVKTGAGTLILTAANTHTGGMTLSGGTLNPNNSAAFGSGSLTLSGGSLFPTGGGGYTYANPVVVSAATTTTVFGYGGGGNPTFAGALTGSGTIFVRSDRGTLGNTMISGDISGFTGTLSFDNSGNGVNFQFTGTTPASRDGSQAHFVTSGATTGGPGGWLFWAGAGNTFKIGELAGTGGYILGVGAGMTYEIGALNTDTTYAGAIHQNVANAVNVNKVGSGTLTLTGTNDYTGTTTVTQGTLAVSNTSGSGSGSGAVTVKTTATLAGTGSISGSVSVAAGGFIAPGNAGTGTLTVAAAALSGTYQCQLGVATADRLVITGALAVNPGAVIAVSSLGSPAAASYIIASYGSLTGGLPVVTGIPSGYGLDTATVGQIKLVKSVDFSGWVDSFPGLTDKTLAGDPDNDGASNLLEYVIGGDPRVTGTSFLPGSAIVGSNLVLSYQRNDASEADTSQVGQWSSDMSTWHNIAPVLLSENGGAADSMEIRIPLSNAAGGKLFGRLHVTKP